MSTNQIPLLTITERPDGMSFQAYKELQRQQDRMLRNYKRGRLVFISNGSKTYQKPTPNQ